MSDEQTCIFCLDGPITVYNDSMTEEGRNVILSLTKNTFCPCVYYYHKTCFAGFIVQNMYNCPLCRKSISLAEIQIVSSSLLNNNENFTIRLVNLVLSLSVLIIFITFILLRYIY